MNQEPMPRELKIAMLLDSEREVFDKLTEDEQEDVLNGLELETIVHTEATESMSVSAIRVLSKALDIAIPLMPEAAREITQVMRDGYFQILKNAMMCFSEGRCPDCGRPLKDHDDRQLN